MGYRSISKFGFSQSADSRGGTLWVRGMKLASIGFVLSGVLAAEAANLGTSIAPALQSVNSVQAPTCAITPEFIEFKPPSGGTATVSACNSCAQKINSLKQDISAKAKTASASDMNVANTTAQNIQQTAAGTQQVQKGTQAGQAAQANTGSAGQANRAGIANGLGAEFDKCASEAQSACPANAGSQAQQAGQQLAQACQQGSAASKSAAAQNASDSAGMGDLSQLASALGQALGAMGQQQPQSTPSETPPYENPYSNVTPATQTESVAQAPSTVKLEEPASNNSVGINTNPNGAAFSKLDPNKANLQAGSVSGGVGSTAASSSPLSASEFGDQASSGSAAVKASGGGGGGGSFGSSGASQLGSFDKNAAAAAGAAAGESGAYDISGGGGRPAILGLKGSTGEEGDMSASLGGAEMLADELGITSGSDRGPASVNQANNADVHHENASNLFRVIHSKYQDIKRRGSI